MVELNIWAAWLGILAGVVTGVAQGLSFHHDDWLGGYASWPRRMMRLGHVSLFGIALLNLAVAVTVRWLGWVDEARAAVPAGGLLAAAVLMPAVCYASAWRKPVRHLFFLPVGCVLVGVVGLILARSVTP